MNQVINTPSISRIEEHDDFSSTVIIEPLLGGYGMTLGNSLRRVLLSSIAGLAIVAFKIEGANHEFMTIPGLKEDIYEIMLNIKDLKLKLTDPHLFETNDDPQILTLSKKGSGAIKASDIGKHPGIEIVNKNHLIATIDNKTTKLDIEFLVAYGRGYLDTEKSNEIYHKTDYINLDAVFSPVVRVNHKVDQTRHKNITNLDKLSLTIKTDGSLTAKDAFNEAASILKQHYEVLAQEMAIQTDPFVKTEEEITLEESKEVDKRLLLPIESLQLSVRTSNALINNELQTVGDVIKLSDQELVDLKGFGHKALAEWRNKLTDLGFDSN